MDRVVFRFSLNYNIIEWLLQCIHQSIFSCLVKEEWQECSICVYTSTISIHFNYAGFACVVLPIFPKLELPAPYILPGVNTELHNSLLRSCKNVLNPENCYHYCVYRVGSYVYYMWFEQSAVCRNFALFSWWCSQLQDRLYSLLC